MKEMIFLNGKFAVKEEGCVSVNDPGFLSGWGAFETMRFKKGTTIYLDEHINRLHSSCRLLDIDMFCPAGKLRSIISQTVKRNALAEARVRVSVWKKEAGCGMLVTAARYSPLSGEKYRKGFRLCIAGLKQDGSSVLARIKSMNRLLYELSYEQAGISGYDEALILNNRGQVTECSRANIFFSSNGELFTPALQCGCLNGVTRMVVLDLARDNGIRVSEAKYTIKDLESADEVFLTNSLLGIMPVQSIEGKKTGRAARRPLSGFLSEKYSRLWNLQK